VEQFSTVTQLWNQPVCVCSSPSSVIRDLGVWIDSGLACHVCSQFQDCRLLLLARYVSCVVSGDLCYQSCSRDSSCYSCLHGWTIATESLRIFIPASLADGSLFFTQQRGWFIVPVDATMWQSYCANVIGGQCLNVQNLLCTDVVRPFHLVILRMCPIWFSVSGREIRSASTSAVAIPAKKAIGAWRLCVSCHFHAVLECSATGRYCCSSIVSTAA